MARLRNVYLVAARRTAVAPRNGAFAKIEVADLASAIFQAVLADARCDPAAVDQVVMGNALYGGGNPARVAALDAGMSFACAAQTIDTQCCAGLDAINIAAALIASGRSECVLAGGMESFSRAPLRLRRPRAPGEQPQPYRRPPFAPWPDSDPDMVEAAAVLAAELKIDRRRQESFAVMSHQRALQAIRDRTQGEVVSFAGLENDAFTRTLDPAVCARLPVLAGDSEFGVTAATTAVEADAAAVVLLVTEGRMRQLSLDTRAIRFVAAESVGGDPRRPGLAPIAAAKTLLERNNLQPGGLAIVEIMEAFAAQAIAFVDALELPANGFNRGGGALSRGHPIGASGAILATRLFHELQKEAPGAIGLAAIAAAGGLGSAMLLKR